MKTLRSLLLVGIGMVLGVVLVWGVNVALAQGPGENWRGWMMEQGGMMGAGTDHTAMHAAMHGDGATMPGGMMGKGMDHTAMHASMHGDGAAMSGGMMGEGMDHTAMHATMHDGEAMPEACQTMMDDPAMMGAMMQMMQDGEHMSIEAAGRWMTEQGIPAETQAECLAHMAEHHPASETPTE